MILRKKTQILVEKLKFLFSSQHNLDLFDLSRLFLDFGNITIRTRYFRNSKMLSMKRTFTNRFLLVKYIIYTQNNSQRSTTQQSIPPQNPRVAYSDVFSILKNSFHQQSEIVSFFYEQFFSFETKDFCNVPIGWSTTRWRRELEGPNVGLLIWLKSKPRAIWTKKKKKKQKKYRKTLASMRLAKRIGRK